MLTDYTHTGAPTSPDLRLEFFWDFQRDIIDAPDFLPLGYHFVTTNGKASEAHTIRPGAFASTK